MAEVYFVGSDGDSPDIITFSLEAAIKEGDRFIDIFDENGKWVGGYERTQPDGEYVRFEIQTY